MPLRALAPQASASTYSATRTMSAIGGGAREGYQSGRERSGTHFCAITGQDGAVSITDDTVVEHLRALIQCASVNHSDGSGPGERKAAEYVAAVLSPLGAGPQVVESAPGRANVLARLAGSDASRPPLLVHAHLDVVPADAHDWRFDPFAAEVHDDYVWGRGAVDMLDTNAMILTALQRLHASGRQPQRDIVLAFTADEEAGGTKGAHWLVRHQRDHFEGCTEAIGEVGGFSITVAQQRLYLIETAEKGIAWLRLKARGTAGHGSLRTSDNAVVHLAQALARIGTHQWPVQLSAPVNALLTECAEILDLPFDPQGPEAVAQAEAVVTALGDIGRMIAPTLRHNANPTMVDAGYKINVVPGQAQAQVDGRFLPGGREEFLSVLHELAGPHVEIEHVHDDIALETDFSGDLVTAIRQSLLAHDPTARVVPYMLSGGTDGKAFSMLGMKCVGFSPLQLPANLDFAALFHGVDERVPISALQFGTDVLEDFLLRC